jgi:uncharacterized protein YxjI
MSAILDRNLFFVKEHVGMFKAANNYDICDPDSGDIILECREENLGFITKLLRFTDYKRMTPFNIIIKDPEGKQVLRISRGISIFLSKVEVYDEKDTLIGGFKQKFFSLGGAFNVLDANDEVVCMLKGKWHGWDFKFIHDEVQFAQVSKKWAGLGKELFTSADNYILEINDTVPSGNPVRKLIMAAIMCIDMVLKE